MKTTHLLLAGFSVFALLACVGNKQQYSEEFHSSDLSSFFLQGPVKSLEYNDQTFTFDQQGRIIEVIPGYSNYDGQSVVIKVAYDMDPNGVVVGGSPVRRDGEGRLLWMGFEDGCSGETGYHLDYHPDNALLSYYYDTGDCTGLEYIEVKTMDDTGLPLQENRQSGDEQGSYESTCDYEYVLFDHHGNWTERKVKVFSRETTYVFDEDTGMDGEEVKTDTAEKIEKRVISYYE